MTAVVATLFEAGHYEAGVAALLNSLFEAGFRGRVWCGVRGGVPSWLQADAVKRCVGDAIAVTAVDVATDLHLVMYKPHFMRLVAQQEVSATSLVYFDPDVVVKCGWPFVERWCGRGIAAVGDANWLMPASSPVRCDWATARRQLGLTALQPAHAALLDIYCNAGFVGVSRECAQFWTLWQTLIDRAAARGKTQIEALSEGRAFGPWQADQDLLNMALMEWSPRVHVMGPEAMDFAPGGAVFSHATGTPKPWQRRFIRSALAGRAPTKRDREHFRYRAGPFCPLGAFRVRRQVMSYRLARVIGVVARRTDY